MVIHTMGTLQRSGFGVLSPLPSVTPNVASDRSQQQDPSFKIIVLTITDSDQVIREALTTLSGLSSFETQPYARVFGGSFLTSTATPMWMMLFLIA